jgi:pSer/pThr/pTyr-binding forkhead associated (FHA) protein
LPKNRDPNEQEVTLALTAEGVPTWTEADFLELMQTLGNAGYGWLRSEGVRQELQTMVSAIAKSVHPSSASSSASGSASAPSTAFETAFGSTFETAFPTGIFEPEPPVPKVILSVIEGSLKGQEYEFRDRTTCIIGRAKDCNLQLPNDEYHKTVSRYHCLLDINPPVIRIRDLGSLHGTYVNGQMIGRRQPNQDPEQLSQDSFPSHELKTGDEIKLGKTIFQVQIEEPPDNPPGTAIDTRTAQTSFETSFDQTAFAEPQRFSPAPLDGVALHRAEASAVPEPATPSRGGDFNSNHHAVQAYPVPELPDYAILKPIHKNSFQQVYLVRHAQSQDLATLRVLQPKPGVRPAAIEACLRSLEEIQILQHPHIAKQIAAGYSNATLYVLQEYCDQGSVVDLMQEGGGQLSLTEAIGIMLQVLDALEYAHTVTVPLISPSSDAFHRGHGLVHRDLRPANILLSQVQGTLVAKVGNYGLAKAIDRAGLGSSETGNLASPLFMPRQRAVNFNHAEPEVDVWAAAACLYHMLTGTYPRNFSGKDPYLALLQNEPTPIQQHNSKIPPSLAEVIDTALVDNPEIQVKDAATFRRMLEGIR